MKETTKGDERGEGKHRDGGLALRRRMPGEGIADDVAIGCAMRGWLGFPTEIF